MFEGVGPSDSIKLDMFEKKEPQMQKRIGRLGRGKVLSNFPSQAIPSISSEPHFLKKSNSKSKSRGSRVESPIPLESRSLEG